MGEAGIALLKTVGIVWLVVFATIAIMSLIVPIATQDDNFPVWIGATISLISVALGAIGLMPFYKYRKYICEDCGAVGYPIVSGYEKLCFSCQSESITAIGAIIQDGRTKSKIGDLYKCERCGEVDYPVIVNGGKFCNHCSGAANPKNHEAYMEKLKKDREAIIAHANEDERQAKSRLITLIEATSYNTKTISEANHYTPEELEKLEKELANFFVNHQLPNNIRIATESLDIIRKTVNFDTFFSRVDVCHNVIRGWWAEDTFFKEVDKQKVRLLRDSLQRLVQSVAELKRTSTRESRTIDYIGVLQKYKYKLETCAEYEKTLQEAKALLSKDTLQSVENNTYIDKTRRGSGIQLDGYTNEEAIFIDAIARQAGKHVRYLIFNKELNGGIRVLYRKPRQGQLNIGIVKLQGRAKYIKINNVGLDSDYDSVYRVDGELDVLLLHIDKFIEKIENNETIIT